jgi:serine/threonine-protein kinase
VTDPKRDDVTTDEETREWLSHELESVKGDASDDALTVDFATRDTVAPDDLMTVATGAGALVSVRGEGGAGAASAPGAASSTSTSKSDPRAERKDAIEKAQSLVGTMISDRYQVEEMLAAGGMGCVYRGQHVHMHKRVAIKVLLPNTERLSDLVLRFQREAVAGAHIDHPNVAAATDFGQLPDGSYYLILQYVRGVTLQKVIKAGPLAPARAVHIARQIASALDACHRMGVIHRDLKPQNIMIEEDRSDAVKLIDFGFAKVPMDRISTVDVRDAAKALKVTTMGVVFGTPRYMAPEAALGMDSVDERSDLYALGVILYEMLAGAHPFQAASPTDVFRMHRTIAPPAIAARSPGVEVPPEVEAVVMRLMKKEPAARFESARAVMAALDAAMPGASPERGAPADSLRPPSSAGLEGFAAGGLFAPASATLTAPPLTAPPAPAPASATLTAPPASAPASTSPQAAATAPPPSEYIPRLARGPAAGSAKTREIPKVAIIGAAAAALAAIIIVVIVIASGGSDSKKTSRERAIKADGAIADAAEALGKATARAGKGAEKPAADSATTAIRGRMRAAADAKEWGKAATALLELVDTDPAAFDDREVALLAITIAPGIQLGGGEKADKIFDALTNKLGAKGLDILYEIVSTRGGSKASERAAKILREKEVFERASPALQVAIELRDASTCQERLALLGRAKTEGDTRAVAVLDILRQQQCVAKSGECCFKTNPAVDDTVKQIWARARSPQ